MDPERIPALTRSDILVELHEFCRPDMADVLRRRFSGTHQIELIPSRPRSRKDLPPPVDLTEASGAACLDEQRPGPMNWFWMTAKAATSGPTGTQHCRDRDRRRLFERGRPSDLTPGFLLRKYHAYLHAPDHRGKLRIVRFLERWLIPPEGGVFGIERDLRMLLHPRDAIEEQLLRTGSYEPLTLDFLELNIAQGDHCLVAGANNGLHVMVAARCAGENGCVIGVEPQPRSLARAMSNVGLNRLPATIRLVSGGVGRQREIVPMSEAPTGCSGHGSMVLREAGRCPYQVPVDSVPNILAALGVDHLDCMLLDVEGYEPPVLAGMASGPKPRWMVIEIHPIVLQLMKTEDTIYYDALQSLGYDCFDMYGRTVGPGSHIPENNAVGVRRGCTRPRWLTQSDGTAVSRQASWPRECRPRFPRRGGGQDDLSGGLYLRFHQWCDTAWLRRTTVTSSGRASCGHRPSPARSTRLRSACDDVPHRLAQPHLDSKELLPLLGPALCALYPRGRDGAAGGIEQLRKHFPDARLIRRKDADGRSESELRATRAAWPSAGRTCSRPKCSTSPPISTPNACCCWTAMSCSSLRRCTCSSGSKMASYRLNTVNRDVGSAYSSSHPSSRSMPGSRWSTGSTPAWA